jgi:hypothetical protein
MTMTLILGGWYLDDGQTRQQLPLALNPSNDDISRILNLLRNRTGLGALRKMDIQDGDYRPYEIAVYAQGRQYVPILREYTPGGEHLARTFKNDLAPGGLIMLMGEAYPANAVVEDFDLAIQVFQEFALSGDVSRSLMS